MDNNVNRERISPLRLFLVLVPLTLMIVLGYRFVTDFIDNVRTGPVTTWFAPYVDVTLTPVLHFEDRSEQAASDFVLGFIVADPLEPCQPSWGAYYSLDAAARALDLNRRIVHLREQGGDAVVSFGGAINDELATVCTDTADLTAAYQDVINRYDLRAIDFDIEGAALTDREANGRRAAAVQQLQQTNDELAVWLTLPVAPHGLSDDALAIVDQFLQAGVELAGVNVMTMNYGQSRQPGTDMHEATVAALTATKEQLGAAYTAVNQPKTDQQLWQRIGATPMIGQNDLQADVFTVAAAHDLVEFARSNNLGRLSFWSINRDSPCGPDTDMERVSNTCSGVAQEAQQFTSIFIDGISRRNPLTGLVTTPDSTPQVIIETTGEAPFIRDDPRTSPYPLWRDDRAYDTGAKVVWQGRVYQSKWWTEGDQPDAPVEQDWENPWRYLGPVLESDREAVQQGPYLNGSWNRWSAEQVFLAGDEIAYDGQVFRAKWWSQGDIPQQFPEQPYDHPWEYLGDVDCDGPGCTVDADAAMLLIDYENLTGIQMEIRAGDGVPDTAGALLQAYSGQSGQKTYELLPGEYDLVFKMGAAETVVDAISCDEEGCDSFDIAATLAVDYAGLTNVTIEIRTDDGNAGTAGDVVQIVNGQSGQRSYSVLRGAYDLVFHAGATEFILDSVACREATCDVQEIDAALAVDYGGLADVQLEIRRSDGIAGTAGALVETFASQRGRRSYSILRGSYDLLIAQGAAELIVDDFDCSSGVCSLEDISTELTIDFRALDEPVGVEIHTADGTAGSSGGGLVAAYTEQDGRQSYPILRGSYDVVILSGDIEATYDDIECGASGNCLLHLTTP